MPQKFKRGCISQPQNDNIARPSRIQSLQLFGIPKVFSMVKYCPTVKNQGNEGTCTAFAFVEYLRTLNNMKKIKIDLSERHIYQLALLADGFEGDNYEGTTPDAILNSAKYYGICLANEWIYEAGKQGMPATPDYMKSGLKNCIKEYYWAINDYHTQHSLKDIKAAVYKYNGLYCSFQLVDAFDDYENGIIKTGKIVPEDCHMMYVVGYDDKKEAFQIANSWGTDWGEAGYCWVGYNIFTAMVLQGFGVKI